MDSTAIGDVDSTAIGDVDSSKYCQPKLELALKIAAALGLDCKATSNKELAALHPEYFSYNAKSRKLAYTPKPKTHT